MRELNRKIFNSRSRSTIVPSVRGSAGQLGVRNEFKTLGDDLLVDGENAVLNG